MKCFLIVLPNAHHNQLLTNQQLYYVLLINMSISVCFQHLPLSLINSVLSYVSGYKNQLMYYVVNETTGKIEYRRNVKEMVRVILTGQTNMTNVYWCLLHKMYYPSKPVQIMLGNNTFDCIEHCLRVRYPIESNPNQATRVVLYAEYDENGTTNYVYSKGDNVSLENQDEWDDLSNPIMFWDSYIYRYDKTLKLHAQHACKIRHAFSSDDFTRVVDVDFIDKHYLQMYELPYMTFNPHLNAYEEENSMNDDDMYDDSLIIHIL